MISSSCNFYYAAQVREIDRIAIEEFHIPGPELMARAGRAAFDLLRALWPQVCCIAVVCGMGNIGGDGFVFARLAAQAGMTLNVLQVGDAARLGVLLHAEAGDRAAHAAQRGLLASDLIPHLRCLVNPWCQF